MEVVVDDDKEDEDDAPGMASSRDFCVTPQAFAMSFTV
jgi:hypothetical protein